jgi:hypothetical protein
MVLVNKLSCKFRDENKSSMKSLCHKFSVLAVISAAAALVAITVAVTCFQSLPEYTVVYYVYPLESNIL